MKGYLFLLLLSQKLLALYMGNPCAPELVNDGFFFCAENGLAIKVGYQRDWTFDRSMKAVSKISGRMDIFDFIADQGVLTVNLFDRIELYGSAGAACFHTSHCPAPRLRHEYKSRDQWLWGVGFRGIFATWKEAFFGINGAYQEAHPKMKWITVNGAPEPLSDETKLSYAEWQIGMGASYQIDSLIPYVGIKYSSAAAEFKHLSSGLLSAGKRFKTKSRQRFGIAIGTTLSNENLFAATVEARLVDEQSITLAAEVKF